MLWLKKSAVHRRSTALNEWGAAGSSEMGSLLGKKLYEITYLPPASSSKTWILGSSLNLAARAHPDVPVCPVKPSLLIRAFCAPHLLQQWWHRKFSMHLCSHYHYPPMATWDQWISSCSETYFAQILQIVSSFGCPLRALHAQKFDENGQKTTECKQ